MLRATSRAAIACLLGGVGCSSASVAPPMTATRDAGKDATASKDATPDAAPDAATIDAGVDAPPAAPTLITEPDQGMTPVYAFMKTATKSLDMTMYELEDDMVTSLLTTAAKNGVTVRVILDTKLEMSRNTTAYNALNQGGVSAHWANPAYAATHQKTITVDGVSSAIMTLNLTPEYYSTSREFVVITSDPKDVAAIEATFDADFTSTAITPDDGDDLVWSPTNAESALLGIINGATSSLLVENEEMSEYEVVDALAAAAKKGVSVEVVMTDQSSWDSAFTLLVGAGAKVSTYSENASLYIHAKAIVADYGEPQASVFIGSENFSDASLTKNRELGIVTKVPAILDSVHATMSKDFTGGTPYP